MKINTYKIEEQEKREEKKQEKVLLTEEDRKEIRRIVKLALIRIGIRTDLMGFSCLYYAVEKVIEDPSLIHDVCKRLYPAVSDEFENKNAAAVERDIRHAIEETYLDKGFEEINKMFGAKLFSFDRKPKSAEFIRLLAEYYLIGLWK